MNYYVPDIFLGWFRVDSLGREAGDGVVQRLDLDDEVVQPARADPATGGIADEFEADVVVVGELEHRQAAERRLGHFAELLVTEPGVERERPLQIGDPEADVQGSHVVLSSVRRRMRYRMRVASEALAFKTP